MEIRIQNYLDNPAKKLWSIRIGFKKIMFSVGIANHNRFCIDNFISVYKRRVFEIKFIIFRFGVLIGERWANYK